MKKSKINAVALAAVACVAAPLAGVLSAYADEGVVFDAETACNDTEACTFADGTLTVAQGANLTFTVKTEDIKNVVNNGTLTLVGEEGAKIQATTGDTIVNNGDLTISGSIVVDVLQHQRAALYNNGTATLLGGTYERSLENGAGKNDAGDNSYYTILNHGNMIIRDGATVKSNSHFSSLLDNGYYGYTSTDPRVGYVEGIGMQFPTLTIEGGTFDGGLNTIKNDDGATITIKGGTFKNFTQAVFQNHNVASVSGGTFDGTSAEMVINNHGCGSGEEGDLDKGELTITGGEFIVADDGVLIDNNGSEGWVKISGGKFSVAPASSFIVSGYHYDSIKGAIVENTIVPSVPVVPSEVENPLIAIADLDTLKAELSKTEAIASILEGNVNANVELVAPVITSEDLTSYYDEAKANGDETLLDRVAALTTGVETIGMFDATLKVNGTAISELDAGITLTLALPEATVAELENVPEGKVREYYVVRIHEVVNAAGEKTYEVSDPIPAELKDGALVFKNDKFSILIAVYKDVDAEEEEEEEDEEGVGNQGAFTAENGNGATAAALGMAIVTGLTTAAVSFKKLYKKGE